MAPFVYISNSDPASAPLSAVKSWASYLAAQTLILIVCETGVVRDPTS